MTHSSGAEAVLIAGVECLNVERTPAALPIYWIQPLPVDVEFLTEFLSGEERREVSFGMASGASAMTEFFRDEHLEIRAVRALGPDDPARLVEQLHRILRITRGTSTSLCVSRGVARFRVGSGIELDWRIVPGAAEVEEYRLPNGTLELYTSDGTQGCSFVPRSGVATMALAETTRGANALWECTAAAHLMQWARDHRGSKSKIKPQGDVYLHLLSAVHRIRASAS